MTAQLSSKDLDDIVARFTPPWDRMFETGDEHGNLFIRVQGYVRDMTNPKDATASKSWQAGPWQYVSPNSTPSSIFRMMLAMLIAYEEHEIREAVLVDGERVFGPHIIIEALKTIAEDVEL